MLHSSPFYFKPFIGVDHSVFFEDLKRKVIIEINKLEKEYLLSVNVNELRISIQEIYTLKSISLDIDKLNIKSSPNKLGSLEELKSRVTGEMRKHYSFDIVIPFSGSDELFKIKPSSLVLNDYEISVNVDTKTLSIPISVEDTDAEAFEFEKNSAIRKLKQNIININAHVENWNTNLFLLIEEHIINKKNDYQKEKKFFEAIGLKQNPETVAIFNPVVLQKTPIPQPISGKKFVSEPVLKHEIYEDIISIFNASGKNMEKKPSLYRGKDEESLRDLFVFLLETRYQSTTAGAEAFNKDGKTDIILKYEDGSNLFVAECKIWSGAKNYLEAISQLLVRYLTWRDSKVAVMLFVKNRQMTKVVQEIKHKTINHPNYIKEIGGHGDTSISYIFNLPQDNKKEIYLEIMVFHFCE